MLSDDEVEAYLGGLSREQLEAWRVKIVDLKEQREVEGVASAKSLLRGRSQSVHGPIDISQLRHLPSPRRSSTALRRVHSYDEYHTTSESLDANDVGPDLCFSTFVACHVGSVWFVRLRGLFDEASLSTRSREERRLIIQSSIAGEVVQRREDSIVLRLVDIPVRVELRGERAFYTLKKTAFDSAQVSLHFSTMTIAALRTSYKLADFDRYQLLLAVLKDAPCFVSERQWLAINREEDGGGGADERRIEEGSDRGSAKSSGADFTIGGDDGSSRENRSSWSTSTSVKVAAPSEVESVGRREGGGRGWLCRPCAR